ncbi:hypothetical protein B566_EDAN013843 [Ephemera danica]|nr:hypothetical protein B566_EDAN013843 [Ephemera danica]
MLNNETLETGTQARIKNGDTIILGSGGIYKYRFCYISASELYVPPTKKVKLACQKRTNRLNFEQNCQRSSEIHSRIEAAKYEQSQIQVEEVNLENSYQQKINALEKKFEMERKKMESRAVDGEEHQKFLEKSRAEMEARLCAEKEDIRIKFENEKELLQQKVEEQRQAELRLKEENEKLQAQIEAERKEFELQLAEERRQLEQSSAEAKRKAEEERLQMENRLKESLEQLKQHQEKEKCRFNEELEKGTLDKQKLIEEHEKEKQQLEERLQQMEQALREKEEQQKQLNEELARKEEEKMRELENLRAQQEEENLKIREEMETRELTMRLALDKEIAKLRNEKLKLEADIRVEMNVESLENKHRYEVELEKVKKQLGLMESKKQVLEQELASNTEEKEKINENCLQAKQKVLEDFGEMMQSELQCNICSELFVVAMTLNCTHTFCKLCITEWKRKRSKQVADCPVCRAPIVSENRSIVLDNFIDKMVESLTDDLKEQRRELLIERGVLQPAPSNKAPKPSTSNNTVVAGPSSSSASTSHAASRAPQQHPHPGYFMLNPTVQGPNRPTVLLTMPPGSRVQGNIRVLTPIPNFHPRMLPPNAVPIRVPANHGPTPTIVYRGTLPQGIAVNRNATPPGVNAQYVRAPPLPVIVGGVRQRGGVRAGRGGAPAVRRHAQGPAPRQNVPVAAPRTAPGAPQARPAAAPVQNAQNVPVPPVAAEVEVRDERTTGNWFEPPTHVVSSGSEVDSDDDDDSIIVPGLPHGSYGGYGKCFNCGMKGHWSPGCPFGSRR